MQNISVDEVMNEIVVMADNIHQLLEKMYSNTPKVLITYWDGHPNLLLEAMGNHPKNEDDLFMSTTRKRMHNIGLIKLRLP
jgi:hypothetical protein